MSTNPFHSPFRSHLLQQWARTTKRPPVAVVPWLRPNSEEEEASSGNHHPQRRHHHHHHHHQNHRRDNKHHKQHNIGPPTLSSVDSNCHSLSSAASSSSWSESHTSTHNRRHSPARDFSSLASLPPSPSASSSSSANFSDEEEQNDNENEYDDEGSISSSSSSSSDEYLSGQSVALQSLIIDRRTATRLTFTAQEDDTEKLEEEKHHLLESLDRAVQVAQYAPNHKRTEPFTFKRFLSGSKAAMTLADIAFQVNLLKSKSLPNAESKRKKWLNIPAFLVASVHNNQSPITTELMETTTSPFELLSFKPPETERQLEDYASASAAIQNVLLSLHSEGIGSKWATGPVIQTKEFRELIQADPTDRIAGLIMVGGTDSTKFQNEREEIITKSRRHRRRSLHGDLLQDLT